MFLRRKKSFPSSVPQSASLYQLRRGAARRKPEVIEPRVLVGLHLGTTHSSYAYAHPFKPSPIVTCYDYWPGEDLKRDATPTAIYYKPEVGKANGDLCFSSWGYMAWTEFQDDLAAMRNLPEQAATNANVLSSRDMPVVGFYVTPLRHQLSSSDAGPSSASDLPPGLTLNRVISDYLRAMGNFILRHIQEVHFGSDLSMQDVQCSSGLGRIHVEKQFIELVCQKIGPLGEYFLRFPEYETRLLANWERGTRRFNKFRAFQIIPLPCALVQDWQEHEKRLFEDIENIVNPIVKANLDFIAAQLSQTTGIRVMVVIDRLEGLSDLETTIRHRFGDRVGEIVFEDANEVTMSAAAVRIAQDCFPGPGTKTFDLVVKVIDNVLIKTRQMDNQDWANNNCSKDWGKAAVLQAGNEEAFVGILHDLKCWCTHFLNLTILSGLNSSEQIQSLGDVDKLNQSEQDRILARRAAFDREELVPNLMQLKRHDKSDVMVDHFVDRYSQEVSDQSTNVHFPLLLWNTQDEKTLPIVKHLGHGAYGTVFESVWLGLPCAEKVFRGAENVSFKKEADILATLKHPNIIKLFCCTTDEKSCSLVMELMCTDLRNLMDDKMKDPKHVVPFSLPVAVDIMLQVARGLKYMHEQRVGHRDIKSSNILVNPTSVPKLAEMGYIDVKVADFGLAKAKLKSSTATKQTKDIGTTPYRAPELYTQEEEIAKENYPLKADVYSYGITCAEILTGKIPFPRTEYKRTELLQVIRQGERPPLPLNCPTLLANLIKRCWHTDPYIRPTFLQVCNELLKFKRSPNWSQKADPVELVISAGDHFVYASVHTMVHVLVCKGLMCICSYSIL
ncbi:unnamed protein product [Sphagnum balticum]